jgi:hypothetical protein
MGITTQLKATRQKFIISTKPVLMINIGNCGCAPISYGPMEHFLRSPFVPCFSRILNSDR